MFQDRETVGYQLAARLSAYRDDCTSLILALPRGGVAAFTFTLENFGERLKEEVLRYAETIGSGSFYVRIERRGHAGEIHSQHLEQELDSALRKSLEERGHTPSVDFKDPDFILAAETLDDECGMGLITRTMRKRFSFVRFP